MCPQIEVYMQPYFVRKRKKEMLLYCIDDDPITMSYIALYALGWLLSSNILKCFKNEKYLNFLGRDFDEKKS